MRCGISRQHSATSGATDSPEFVGQHECIHIAVRPSCMMMRVSQASKHSATCNKLICFWRVHGRCYLYCILAVTLRKKKHTHGQASIVTLAAHLFIVHLCFMYVVRVGLRATGSRRTGCGSLNDKHCAYVQTLTRNKPLQGMWMQRPRAKIPQSMSCA